VDGGGRRPGYSSGRHTCFGLAAEVKLIEATLDQVKVPRGGRGRPRKRMPRVIADKAYDSDPLRKRLKQRGIDLICPHRRNRTKRKLQDGRKLRRYRRRYKIERTFAWLGSFRRLVVRYDRLITVYRALFSSRVLDDHSAAVMKPAVIFPILEPRYLKWIR
jgi:transposase